MYSSKCSMSPVHDSRPLNTRWLRLARLLLASSFSVLVSIHIPTAAWPHHYECDECVVARLKKRVPLHFVARFCCFRSSVRSPVASFFPFLLSHPFSPVPPPPLSSPVRFEGMTYKLAGWVTYSLSSQARQEQSPTPSGLVEEGRLVHPLPLHYC